MTADDNHHAYGAASDLFLVDSKPTKFFLQQNLPDAIHAQLVKLIEDHNGRVTDKVPIRGYVLIEPDSEKGQALYAMWAFKEGREERYVLPYTCVQASVKENRRLTPIFVEAGKPLEIHIHKSVLAGRKKNQLISRIYNAGGDPSVSLEDATVVIADRTKDEFAALAKEFDHYTSRFLEPIEWVGECLLKGTCEHELVTRMRVGGRRSGASRTDYTDEDDGNLAAYMAQRLPYKQTPGRTGNKVYQELCSMLRVYPWADRHSWQSWRERYRKNAERFDKLIDKYVAKNPPRPDGKGQHNTARSVSASPARSAVAHQRSKRNRNTVAKVVVSPIQEDSTTEEESDGTKRPAPTRSVQPDPTDELDSWASDWPVRMGDDTHAPAWAKHVRQKRKAVEMESEANSASAKKARLVPPQLVNGAAQEHAIGSARQKERSLQPQDEDVDELEYLPDPTPMKRQLQGHFPVVPARFEPFSQATYRSGESRVIVAATQSPARGPSSQPTNLPANDNRTPSIGKIHWNQGIGAETQAMLDDEPDTYGCSSTQGLFTESIEATLEAIANEYRFVVEEVREEYIACGNIESTRSLFREMRKAADTARRRLRIG